MNEISPVGKAPPLLGAIVVRAKGEILESNLAEYGQRVDGVLATINMNPSTDDEFATAELAVKAMDGWEEELAKVAKSILAQMETIDIQYRLAEDLREKVRGRRLPLQKAIKEKKEQIRASIIDGANRALDAHLRALSERLGFPFRLGVAIDFVGAIRGKKNLSSMQDAADTELAKAKIEASAKADLAQANIKRVPDELRHLFPDLNLIAAAPNFQSILEARIDAEMARRAAEEAKRLEDERRREREEAARREEERRLALARQGAEAARLEGERVRREAEAAQQAAERKEEAIPTAREPATNSSGPSQADIMMARDERIDEFLRRSRVEGKMAAILKKWLHDYEAFLSSI